MLDVLTRALALSVRFPPDLQLSRLTPLLGQVERLVAAECMLGQILIPVQTVFPARAMLLLLRHVSSQSTRTPHLLVVLQLVDGLTTTAVQMMSHSVSTPAASTQLWVTDLFDS
jgi:hypothetical protein